MWKAEEANAARLAARSNLVLSGITAIIGLKVFTLGRELDTILAAKTSVTLVLFWQAFGLAVIFLAWALWLTLDARFGSRKGSSSASQGFAIDEDILEHVLFCEDVEQKEVAELVFSVAHNAASDLQNRNATRGTSIAKAQLLFFVAVGLAVASMVLYTMVKLEQGPIPGVSNVGVKGATNDADSNPGTIQR